LPDSGLVPADISTHPSRPVPQTLANVGPNAGQRAAIVLNQAIFFDGERGIQLEWFDTWHSTTGTDHSRGRFRGIRHVENRLVCLCGGVRRRSRSLNGAAKFISVETSEPFPAFSVLKGGGLWAEGGATPPEALFERSLHGAGFTEWAI
jgi:hypothetical protein